MKSKIDVTAKETSEKKGMTSQFHSMYQAKLFKGVPENEFEQMLSTLDSQLKYYQANQIIVEEGQPIQRAGLLMSGSLFSYQNNFWNEKTPLEFYEPDAIFCESVACSDGITSNYTIEAKTPSVVLWFNVQQIFDLSDQGSYHTILIQNLMNDIAQKNVRLNEKIYHMSQHTTREKLISYLSLEAARTNSCEFDISLNRQELADYLSVERTAMCNEISKLRKDGYLDTKRNHFILYEKPQKKEKTKKASKKPTKKMNAR